MRARTVGAACWLVQPAYVLVELLVAAAAPSAYSLRDDTISALGMLTCSPLCSPRHAAMNAAFVAFGLLRATGARLLRPELGRGRWGAAAVWLWVVAALAAAAIGLLPVDQQPRWHALAALPVFVLQPLAVLLTAERLQRSATVSRGVTVSGFLVGGATLAAAASFALRLGSSTWVGGLERLALWPAYLWLVVVAAAVLAASRPETVVKP